MLCHRVAMGYKQFKAYMDRQMEAAQGVLLQTNKKLLTVSRWPPACADCTFYCCNHFLLIECVCVCVCRMMHGGVVERPVYAREKARVCRCTGLVFVCLYIEIFPPPHPPAVPWVLLCLRCALCCATWHRANVWANVCPCHNQCRCATPNF